MRDIWQMWSGYLNETLCDRVIEYCKDFPLTEPNIGFGDKSKPDKSYRNSKIRWIDPSNSIISPIIIYLVLQANKNAFNYELFLDIKELQFSEYHEDYQSHYDWHYDTDWNNPENFDRKLSVVIQLSKPESYVGGDFLFESGIPQPDHDILKKQGTVIIFPSFLSHKVTNVTFGNRYSLVTWIHGPRFK